MTQDEVFQEVMNLRNELLSSKNLIDQSPEVKTSRRLQGAISRCTVLLTRLSKGQSNVASETGQPASETVSNG